MKLTFIALKKKHAWNSSTIYRLYKQFAGNKTKNKQEWGQDNLNTLYKFVP